MQPNGHYEVRLSVVDKGGNRNRVTRKYVVEGSLKTGTMNLGFTDITAAMGGAKINVNRSYSSADKNKGDFGIGWNLGMQGWKEWPREQPWECCSVRLRRYWRRAC